MITRADFTTSILKYAWARYAVAVLVVGIALSTRWLLNPFLGDSVPYVTIYPAIAFSAWYCGARASILAVVLSVIPIRYWFISPIHTFGHINLAEWLGLLTFVLSCTLIVAMGRARRLENERLRIAQGELEQRVQERTQQLDTANQNLRDFSARLMQLQDDERRRIARELHDSVGQMLVGLTMNLSAVRIDIERLMKTADSLTDSEAMVQEMSSEIRTISHLLHPPLLDEAGLSSAVRWYVDGFSERSRIKVKLEFPEDFGRLPREFETAIFRIVQESLTNVHRHSESQTARIRISQSEHSIYVEVEDKGKGISTDKRHEVASVGTPGVGLRGMRERLRQLGGSLEINSDGKDKGTLIIAKLPVPASSTTAAA